MAIGSAGNSFILTVSNTGSAQATNVRVTDTVDGRLTVTQVLPTAYCGASSGQVVDCTFPTVAIGGSQVVTVTYAVGAGVSPATVANVAQASDGFQQVEGSDSVTLVAGGECSGLPAEINLESETITGFFSAEACDSVMAHVDVDVMNGGDAWFATRGVIILGNGFSVEAGGEFTAAIDPLLGQ